MHSIVLVGSGNLANHLFDAILGLQDFEVVQVIGRNKESLGGFSDKTQICTRKEAAVGADIYVLAVSDGAIKDVSDTLAVKQGLIVHTAGMVAMDTLDRHPRHGVFYPLQSFSKGRKINFREVPLCIEAKEQKDLEILNKLAAALSDKVAVVDSEKRRILHLAAVFVNNFTNHLYQIGFDICNSGGLASDLLKPIIRETAEKIQNMDPIQAQTGPARRGDQQTMEAHRHLLSNSEQREIYETLSASIASLYGKEL